MMHPHMVADLTRMGAITIVRQAIIIATTVEHPHAHPKNNNSFLTQVIAHSQIAQKHELLELRQLSEAILAMALILTATMMVLDVSHTNAS